MATNLFGALGIERLSPAKLRKISTEMGIEAHRLKYFNEHHKFPTGIELDKILEYFNIGEVELKLKLGVFDHQIIKHIQAHYNDFEYALTSLEEQAKQRNDNKGLSLKPIFKTKLGRLYNEDCLKFLPEIEGDSVDLVFADPPFNLSKEYPSGIDDNLKEKEYLAWSEKWLFELIRVLKPGGSLFIWNLPKWNMRYLNFIDQYLTFKHWIAVDIKYSLPIPGRLYPSHYSLLYFVNGEKPNHFKPDRLPMPTCPKCHADLRDYGGYKNKMNPMGINLSDVWTDIAPVRHAKYKKRKEANELPLKLMDRIIEMSSAEGSVVLDPFGGAGTTYITAELKNRKWLGSEIGPIEVITERFTNIDADRQALKKIRSGLNSLFLPQVKNEREKKGLWTPESVRENGVKPKHRSKKQTTLDFLKKI